MTKRTTIAEKFWSKVEKTSDCWIWLGAKHAKGYGHIHLGNTVEKAHRVSYRINFGTIPFGMFVLHRCDNPGCVNPDHLFLGTNEDNMADMKAKGRGNAPRGEAQHLSRLSEAAVLSIRGSAETGRRLARAYSVSPQTICDVRKRKTWKHI